MGLIFVQKKHRDSLKITILTCFMINSKVKSEFIYNTKWLRCIVTTNKEVNN